MRVVMVYSEAGGVSKTTTSVSLAMSAAIEGKRVLLIDLDPRAAASSWLDVEPIGQGLHVGAILGSDEDTAGYAEELAIQSTWSPNLRVIPSGRSVSNREADRADHSEIRLARSLQGLEADVVIIDCPNRQGGTLILSALTASDTVVYAAKPNTDGVDGYLGAKVSVERFMQAREAIGAPAKLREAGIVVSGVNTTIQERIERASIEAFEETGMLLQPTVPDRVIVRESRASREWYGEYRKGAPVAEAFAELTREILK